MEAILFWVLAVLLLASAVGVILSKNPVHSAMSLIGSFFFLAAVYVLLRAHLVAGLQILIYAGAIMVLFTFVIMLLSLTDAELGEPRATLFKLIGVLAAGAVSATSLWALTHSTVPVAATPAAGTLTEVARIIFTRHALAFEVVAVLLLVAIVGAVVVAKRRI